MGAADVAVLSDRAELEDPWFLAFALQDYGGDYHVGLLRPVLKLKPVAGERQHDAVGRRDFELRELP